MNQRYLVSRKNLGNLSLEEFHGVLSANDGPITYSEQTKDVESLKYSRFGFGNFVAMSESRKVLSLHGELSDKLIKDLKDYSIEVC